jgi:fatty acid desaturase
MEKPASIVEALYERVEAYSKTTIELSKLKALNTTTHVVTTMISRLSVIIMLALFALVMNIGIALWLGELLGKNYYGFFIVAVFYLVAGIVLHFFLHNWIKKPISDLIITQALQ